MCSEQKINCKGCVALFTRAWIEIDLTQVECAKIAVALFTRAWIEIIDDLTIFNYKGVALFTRAWIEIPFTINIPTSPTVALFTRAWIEIVGAFFNACMAMSPSSRGRGLKFILLPP